MKKLFLAMVAVAAFAFVGCDKDDEKTPSTDNIAGSWDVYKSYWEEEGVEFGEKFSKKYWEYMDEDQHEIYTFETNGIFSLSIQSGNYRDDYSGTYTINGKSLTLVYYSEPITYTIKSLSSNDLVLIEKYESDSYKEYGEIYLKRLN